MNILNNFYHNLNSEIINSYALVIDREGNVLKDILDEDFYNHAVSFSYLAYLLNIPYIETRSVIKAAKNLNDYGNIALQKRGEYCVIYFPESITIEQYNALYELLIDKDLMYSCGDVEGFLVQDDVLEYAQTLIQVIKKIKSFKGEVYGI